VVCSRRAYDDPKRRFVPRETWRGVRVLRVVGTGLGKKSKWRRKTDFASFLLTCLLRILFLPRFDLIITMTSPPMISALGAVLAKLRGGTLVSWVLDLNPDEAIAAQWLREDSLLAKVLRRSLAFSLANSQAIIALDIFMARRLRDKGVPPGKITVIPPWSHDQSVAFDEAGRRAFREEHGLDAKFVVMYSGNHSPCHPLDTILDAAERLRDHPDVAFCFVGGGSEFRKVQVRAADSNLRNVHCFPYQPLSRLSASLSSADLHLVVMGDPLVGIVHACKVYNIRSIGIPFAYVGPSPSHVTELGPSGDFRHGDVDGLTEFIRRSAAVPATRSRVSQVNKGGDFSQAALLVRMVSLIESLGPPRENAVAAEFVSVEEDH
jgi:hypothetical protein